MEQIIRLPAVLERTGLAKTTLYRRIAESQFPKPIPLGAGGDRAVGWLASEVDAWIVAQGQQREARSETRVSA